MARGRGAKQFFKFTGGWITEATPTAPIENTAKDIENVIIDQDGSIRRRPGLDFESGGALLGIEGTTTQYEEHGLSFHEWLNVGGSGTTSFTVTQAEMTLIFHRQNGDSTSATKPIAANTVDIIPFAIDLAKARDSLVSVTQGLGFLFVVGRHINPFFVEFTGTAFVATAIDIQIRDFEGTPVKDFLDGERPKTVTPGHVYDLLNAGWPVKRINIYAESDVLTGEAFGQVGDVTIVNATAGKGAWVSRSDIHYLGVRANNKGDLEFDIATLNEQTFGNTPSPKGRFILNAFNKDRVFATGLTGATNEVIGVRPEAVAFHSGRVFYSGLFAEGNTGNVYFSQQLTDVKRAGRCYQEQDPTAETFNDLLDTDGGLIPIPNAGQILAMREGANGVVVFAGNGVWEITGSDGAFSATNFGVRKITDIGCVGAETVIEADGQFLYWSEAGIIALAPDSITAKLNAQNITNSTIQIGYLLIGGIQRKFARGVFITQEKKAVWLYSSDTTFDGIKDRWKCNRLLILDLVIGAFYKYSITDTASKVPYAVGIIKTIPFTSAVVAAGVAVTETSVTVSAASVTISTESFGATDITSWKLLVTRAAATAGKTDLTMAEFSSRSWHDWFRTDGVGVNYTSFLETSYENFGNVVLDKQPTYVFTYFSPESKSLRVGGYFELPAKIGVATLGNRVTQVALETLVTGDSKARTTQAAVEVVGTYDSKSRVTQVALEVLFTP